MEIEALAARLAETFTPEQRQQLIAALLAAQPAPAAPECISLNVQPPQAVREAALQTGPPVDDGTPNEAEDTLPERARLLAILAAHPSGLSGYTLLDAYRIPPSTIENAMRDGQVARAERGIGLTTRYGGAW
jgi:hypothetical protein